MSDPNELVFVCIDCFPGSEEDAAKSPLLLTRRCMHCDVRKRGLFNWVLRSALEEKITPPSPERTKWLLSPVSSIGRLTIHTPQYEELRHAALDMKRELDFCQMKIEALVRGFGKRA